MSNTRFNPETLLSNAEAHASRSVRIARSCLGNPSVLESKIGFWKRLSSTAATLAPIMLLLVIAGSLFQTNSSLVETLWEVTAAATLLAGLVIAFSDSRHFYLKPVEQTAAIREELLQLENKSSQARAWHTFLREEGRRLHQFDLEIMWALATLDNPSTDNDKH